MAIRRCAACGLINPVTAAECDCGYSFADGTLRASRRQKRPMRASTVTLIAAVMIPVFFIVGLIALQTLRIFHQR